MDNKGGTMANGTFGRFAGWIRLIKAPESLDELPEASSDARRALFFSRILKSESLPFDEAVSGGLKSPSASGLFASEPLPLDDRPEQYARRASFIATLFSREMLPVDPAPGPGPISRGPGHR
jgi:hypothetical protein